jgi:hypothetical protein
MASTFYADGVIDARRGNSASAPDVPVLAREYMSGYRAGLNIVTARERIGVSHEGKYSYWLDTSDRYIYQKNEVTGEWIGWICAESSLPHFGFIRPVFACDECGSSKRDMDLSGIADPICCEVVL